MSAHAAREPQNPQFVEANRLVRELLRTVGLEGVRTGFIGLRMVDGYLRDVEAGPSPMRVSVPRRAE